MSEPQMVQCSEAANCTDYECPEHEPHPPHMIDDVVPLCTETSECVRIGGPVHCVPVASDCKSEESAAAPKPKCPVCLGTGINLEAAPNVMVDCPRGCKVPQPAQEQEGITDTQRIDWLLNSGELGAMIAWVPTPNGRAYEPKWGKLFSTRIELDAAMAQDEQEQES